MHIRGALTTRGASVRDARRAALGEAYGRLPEDADLTRRKSGVKICLGKRSDHEWAVIQKLRPPFVL